MNDTLYNNRTVEGFLLSSLVWGVFGIVFGLLISVQLWEPAFNFGPFLSYGRLRTLHISILAYGLGLGVIFGLFYFMLVRLTKRGLVFPRLARFHLWLWNIGVVVAGASLFLGFTQSLEYAEFEWPVDIVVVIIWVIFAVNIFASVFLREEKQMYVSLWYMLASVLAVAVLYLVNNIAIPAGLTKSYHIFSGINSANMEWWYGHNIVGFLLTTPILAMFYYFLPVSTKLPIYSHRLSIVAFWALVFTYLWTGAHHLVYTPLPDWIQTLGIVFSLILIAPSWGSVINGFFTIESDWSKLQENYLTKFFLAAITFYGLQTIQGPGQSVRVISGLVHYTDWVIGHVHMGTMGWVTMTATACMYYVFPKIYNTEIFSVKLANSHFWLVFIGQLMYSFTMWIAGIQQSVMLKQLNSDGTLANTFMDTLVAIYPFWILRTVAGLIFTVGMVIFILNIVLTIVKGRSLSQSRA
ncbi:MAG: cbb3-type cytochrome c oxidase subunit I [Deferribacteraceae bacterium]|jgi:cytochrome c oxidase cbb3-type subunit 1|nr:cbb3-type cytochrome c oxidase subunit I [Deferribacteraceae bacterium]